MMKITSLLVGLFVFVAGQIVLANDETHKPVQIVTPINHSVQLQLNDIKRILGDDNIRDRHVVVVSIAGAIRQGKSFLLNFFIRYLNAQYKKHDVSNWLNKKTADSVSSGFKWRNGQDPETMGIWMWSEIFTHDYANGEKVAIVLLDTQGIFDHQSSMKECATTFAMSMMLSSVQCYNVMRQISENDLINLEQFSEYGRLALERSTEKPFQSLLFIVRDWPNEQETGFGWSGTRVIEKIISKTGDQSHDMHERRNRLHASFSEIRGFLMPSPGRKVAEGNDFSGSLTEIDPKFLEYVRELTPALFKPDKLIVKKINGQPVRGRDLVQFFQQYTKMFAENNVPEPKSIFQATVEVTNSIIVDDCLKRYTDLMKNQTDQIHSYLKTSQLRKIHNETKAIVINQFESIPKLGNDDVIVSTERNLRDAIENQFNWFQQQNDQKHQFIMQNKTTVVLTNATIVKPMNIDLMRFGEEKKEEAKPEDKSTQKGTDGKKPRRAFYIKLLLRYGGAIAGGLAGFYVGGQTPAILGGLGGGVVGSLVANVVT